MPQNQDMLTAALKHKVPSPSMSQSILGFLLRAVLWPERRNPPVRPLRAFVGLPRMFDLASWVLQVADGRRQQTIDKSYAVDDQYHRSVQDYNAGRTIEKTITTTRRAERLYRMLSLARPDIENDRLLIVGPRNRQELVLAWVHGFRWPNIEAIDLYSVNPKIRVMNMEAMSWPAEFVRCALHGEYLVIRGGHHGNDQRSSASVEAWRALLLYRHL